jgi:tetratricopeptide (TPR) repeat protein
MSRRQFSPAQALFFLTFAVRLYVLARLSSTPFFVPQSEDMKFYSDWGWQVAHGVLTDHQAFYGLPGYPFFLALLFKILNFDKFWVSVVAGLIQAVADSLTSVVIWKLATEAFQSGEAHPHQERWFAGAIGCVAAAGWAFYEPAEAFCTVLMPTSLAVAAFWYSVWELTRRRAGGFSNWAPWLPVGFLIGFQSMIVATILFLIPLGLAAIVARWRQSAGAQPVRKAFRPVLAAFLLVAGVFAGASPCWIHNYFIAHEPVMLSAHSGLNFYIGNNPIANGYPKMPPGMSTSQAGMLKDSITIAQQAEHRPLKHYEVSQYWSAKAHEFIAEHPGQWLRLMATKFANFWNSFQYDDLTLITLFQHAGVLIPGLRFGVVAALAIPGMFMVVAKRREAGWILAAVLLHMGALMPVFVTERYRLAAVPGLLALGAYGLCEFAVFLSRARWAPATAYASATAFAAFLVATPPGDASLWSLDHYNTGIKALDEGDYPTARRELETAYRYVQENSEINFALGLLWQQQDDTRRAETFYEQTLNINPRHKGAWNNLGILASDSKAWTTAVRCFNRAIEIDPDDATTHYLQARALAELGQWGQARVSIDDALRLNPAQKEFHDVAGAIESHGPLPVD